MSTRVVTHIRHGNERSIHAWCGLRIDIRPWTSDEDYHAREARGLGVNVCANCKAALAKGTQWEATGR